MILKIKHILNRNKISLAIIFLTIMAVIPASAQMVENFDSAVVPTLPAGWTATNASGPAPLWVTSNSGTPTPVADSAPNAAFINDPNVVSDKILTTPAFSPLSGAQVTFRNNYVLESGFDGGVLEISINGSRFIDIVTAGGSFVTGGYNGTITTTNFGSPIQGRAAWTGTSSGFITTTANLPASAVNQLVRLRFRLGTDNSTAGTGWRIDSFRIADVATSQNFDEVTAPSLPAGWTATNASGPAPLWVTSNSGTPTPVADSAPNAAFIDDPSAVSDKILTTPSFRIGANAQVTFRNNYVLQSGFDGGVLEISINGGVFTDIVTAGGSFVTGGYNGNITTTNFGSPIQGRAAWTGTSGGFITTTANLPVSAVNQLVQLRFRMGSDNSTAGTGWRIDSFQVSLGTFQPTAGGVSISGRVFIESGRGLQNAFVTLTDTTGQTRTCRTNGFGYYHFEDIQAGQTVVLNVESKKYQFASQAVSLTDSLTEFNFMALIPK